MTEGMRHEVCESLPTGPAQSCTYTGLLAILGCNEEWLASWATTFPYWGYAVSTKKMSRVTALMAFKKQPPRRGSFIMVRVLLLLASGWTGPSSCPPEARETPAEMMALAFVRHRCIPWLRESEGAWVHQALPAKGP